MQRDMITDLAHLVYPHPRADEVDPPEAHADAVEDAARQRGEWELNLRTMIEETGEDPLLAVLGEFAEQRDVAERTIRELMAYGRSLPGRGYSWPQMAAAAGVSRNTAERRVTEGHVTDIRTRLRELEEEERQKRHERARGIEDIPFTGDRETDLRTAHFDHGCPLRVIDGPLARPATGGGFEDVDGTWWPAERVQAERLTQ